PRRPPAGGQPGTPTLAKRRVRACVWRARWPGLGGPPAWPHLPPRCGLSADAEASRGGEASRMARARTERWRLGLPVGSGAGEPVHAPRRFEGCRRQEAPEARATAGRPPRLREPCAQVVQTPPGGGMPPAESPRRSGEPTAKRRERDRGPLVLPFVG